MKMTRAQDYIDACEIQRRMLVDESRKVAGDPTKLALLYFVGFYELAALWFAAWVATKIPE